MLKRFVHLSYIFAAFTAGLFLHGCGDKEQAPSLSEQQSGSESDDTAVQNGKRVKQASHGRVKDENSGDCGPNENTSFAYVSGGCWVYDEKVSGGQSVRLQI